MIDRRKLLFTALTPILAGFVLVGSTFASSRKNEPSSIRAQSTDSAASTDKTKSKKKSKKAAKATTDAAKSDTAKATKESKKAAKSTTAETKQDAATTTAKSESKKSAPVEAKAAAPEAAKPAPASSTQHVAVPAKKESKAAVPTNTAVSSSDIASARAKGLVWVNTDSKVYHKDGKYYGNTKQGKFMTEADAEKAGYRSAKK